MAAWKVFCLFWKVQLLMGFSTLKGRERFPKPPAEACFVFFSVGSTVSSWQSIGLITCVASAFCEG